MKYIDSEKLKAEIERLIKVNKELTPRDFTQGIAAGYADVLSFIDTLGQEPEGLHFTPINRLLNKIPSDKWAGSVNTYAKKLVDCLIHEGYLEDAKVVQNYISYMNGNNVPMATMDEQEPKIKGWVARDKYTGHLHLYNNSDCWGQSLDLITQPRELYKLCTTDEPIEVELIIKKV